ncbi:hypothetical protein ON010_g7787 [Phytophthora cinnamomi]|nr:hypothetical protein ON010_g7787 [Phytophthora cinnamomi]
MWCSRRALLRVSSVPFGRAVDAVREQCRLEEVIADLEVGGAVTRQVALHQRLTDPEEHGRLAELEVPLSAERKSQPLRSASIVEVQQEALLLIREVQIEDLRQRTAHQQQLANVILPISHFSSLHSTTTAATDLATSCSRPPSAASPSAPARPRSRASTRSPPSAVQRPVSALCRAIRPRHDTRSKSILCTLAASARQNEARSSSHLRPHAPWYPIHTRPSSRS